MSAEGLPDPTGQYVKQGLHGATSAKGMPVASGSTELTRRVETVQE